MKIVTMNERWVYKGSMPYPPCNQFVYWNIINRVFPVSKEIVDLIHAKQVNAGQLNGNHRVVQNGFNNEVYYVYSSAMKLTAFIASTLFMMVYAY